MSKQQAATPQTISTFHSVNHALMGDRITRIRDRMTAPAEFRRLVREVAGFLGYEALRNFATTSVEIETPLAKMTGSRLDSHDFAVISILRAGNGMLDGILELLPDAGAGFIGLARNHETLVPVEYYFKLPSNLHQRHVFVLDPMLATGNSATAALTKLFALRPLSVTMLSILAAPEGIQALAQNFPKLQMYVAAVDERLNEQGYIYPGLGDAGDRMFGTT